MTVNSINIKWPELFKPIPGLRTDVSNRIIIEREIIPIIFVPGIMGSRLEDSYRNKVWDPDDTGFMVNRYGRIDRTAAYRKAKLIGKQFSSDYLKVSNNDTEHNKAFAQENDPTRVERGWGGVFWGSYGDLLLSLQGHEWKEPVSLCFEFPVHAFGYNWTDTNFNAGKKLADKIDDLIAEYKSKGRLCEYVILVSHSMGGLVCRSACKLHMAEKNVLGVLHGVQPATGAPAAYWRMKAGFERAHGGPSGSLWDWLRNPLKMAEHSLEGRAGAWIFGTDGKEVTCILGNAPGGLELLPNKHYTNNAGSRQWLHVPDRDGLIHSFPRSGDPYKEIYSINDDVFWRMVNPAWLDPGSKNESNNEYAEIDGRWGNYLDVLETPEQFHEMLKMEYHHHTYQFYSSGYETVDEIRYKRNKTDINLEKRQNAGIEFQKYFGETHRGAYIAYLNYNDVVVESNSDVAYKIEMAMPGEYKAEGDSTVPDSSGNALKLNKTVKIGLETRSDWFGQDHQNIYKGRKGKELVFTAVGNFALKRIEEKIGSVGKKGRAL